LRGAGVDHQLDPVDIGAVVGGKEQRVLPLQDGTARSIFGQLVCLHALRLMALQEKLAA
jgi:hypothetical protein